MPATKLDLTVNRPVVMTVKYADVWPGKMWQNKQLPPSLKLTGTIEGVSEDVTVYVPADFTNWLTNAGATSKQSQTKSGVNVTSYTLPSDRRVWVIGKMQDAGEKHPRTEMYEQGKSPARPAPDFTKPPEVLQQAPPEVMPWDGKPAVHLEREAGEMTPLENLFGLWDDCLAHAITAQKERPEIQLDIAAATATLFIQATKIR